MNESSEEIIDLTELIEAGETSQVEQVASPSGSSADDIDKLLAQMDAQDEMKLTRPSGGKGLVDPHESLDMSGMGAVDDLLDSVGIPLEPRNAGLAQSSPVEDVSLAPDLDSAVDELINDVAPPELSVNEPGAVTSKKTTDELHALISEMEPTPVSPSDRPSFAEDLDSFLSDKPLSGESEKELPPVSEPGRGDVRRAHEDSTIASSPNGMEAGPELPQDLDDMLAELGMEKDPAPNPGPEPALAGMIRSSTPPVSHMAPPLSSDAEPEKKSERRPSQEVSEIGIATSPLDEVAAASARQAELFRQESQRLDELSSLAESLSQRLSQCENELAGARAKVEALEKAAASSSLEDLLCEGNSLHDRFAALIARSVSEAFRNAPAQTDPAVIERLENMTMMHKSVSARMDAMENRLDLLEPRFNHEVEKAAAMAVVRILREEIARLSQQ